MNNSDPSDPKIPINYFKKMLSIFKIAVKKVPALKYGYGVIAVAVIFSIISYIKVKEGYAIPIKSFLVIIGMLFLVFLFAFMTRTKDKVTRICWYILSYVLTSYVVVMFFCSLLYLFTGKPAIFNRLFDDNNVQALVKDIDSTRTNPKVPRNSTKTREISSLHEIIKPMVTSSSITISIQLPPASKGYKRILLNGKAHLVLSSSTPFNPRIELKNGTSTTLTIITNSGDTCVNLIPANYDTSDYRIIANCKY